MDPLSEPQIHAAIRALDAGDRPASATLRTALLMALAWHAAQAEIVTLRGRVAGLEDMFERALWPDPSADQAEIAALRAALAPLATVPLADISPGEVARARKLLGEPQEPESRQSRNP